MSTKLHSRHSPGKRRSHQRGAASLVELMVVLLISAVLSGYTLNTTRIQADEATAAATASYFASTTAAAQRYTLVNFAALQASTPVVSGFVSPNAPSLAELKTAGFMSANASTTAPTRQGVVFNLVKSGTCPGTTCQITAMSCLNGAFTLRGHYREDLATITVMKMNGQGGRSQMGAGSIVRGPGSFQQTNNPVGNVEGVVCGQNVFDSAVYDQFVKMNEVRDVNIQGNFGVGSGTDGSGNPCSLGAVLNSGQIVSRSSACIALAWMGKDASGNGQVAVADALGNQRVGLGGDGSITTKDASGVTLAGIQTSGTVYGTNLSTTGALTTNGLNLNKTVSLASACSPDGAGAWAQSAGVWTFARCSGGVWTSVGGPLGAVVSAACPTNGAQAVDASSASLTCTNGIWQSTQDRMGHYVLFNSYLSSDGSVIEKPTCNGTVNSTSSYAHMAIGNESELKLQYVNRYLVDLGTSWQVNIKDEFGATVSADVMVQTYCSYP